jgi:hypothetical protein
MNRITTKQLTDIISTANNISDDIINAALALEKKYSIRLIDSSTANVKAGLYNLSAIVRCLFIFLLYF